MATKDSEKLKVNEQYPLGDYSFRIERSSVPGSSNDKIEAICTKGGKNARKSIQVPSSTLIEGWYVEANETEASVYVLKKVASGGTEYISDADTGNWTPVLIGDYVSIDNEQGAYYTLELETGVGSAVYYTNSYNQHYIAMVIASETYGDSKAVMTHHWTGEDTREEFISRAEYVYNDKKVYYSWLSVGYGSGIVTWDVHGGYEIPGGVVDADVRNVAWTLIYGNSVDPEYEIKEVLVARFAIEIEDAGGVGPGGGTGGGWTDPEDYDEDWEEGDPTHTLYVEVTGALSGRHNDPIEDPSYSYIPADKDTVKDYGCGGDGGHGGGGGAGAATVVIHKFATNQANSKEVTAIARRHGYGSGGGKGGKGGDGCILVYY